MNERLDEVAQELKGIASGAEPEYDPIPPKDRTPVTESGAVIQALCEIWDMWNLGEKWLCCTNRPISGRGAARVN